MTIDMNFAGHGHIGNNKFMQDDAHTGKRPNASWGTVVGAVRGERGGRASSAHPTRGTSSSTNSRFETTGGGATANSSRENPANKRKAFRGDVIREDDRHRMTMLMSKLASLRVESAVPQTRRGPKDTYGPAVIPKDAR
jgi:hypothetical protein